MSDAASSQPIDQLEVYRQARIMAREGLGWEDICAKYKSIPRDHARMIVLGRATLERKTK